MTPDKNAVPLKHSLFLNLTTYWGLRTKKRKTL